MAPDHARAGITHDGLDLFLHPRFIAVNLTVDASRFVGKKRAMFDSLLRVLPYRQALRTRVAFRAVVSPAVDLDHRTDSFQLPPDPSLFICFHVFP